MPNLTQTMLRLWESACHDAPLRPSCQVIDGYFVFRVNGNRNDWAAMCQAAGVPAHAEQSIDDVANTLTCRWPSLADDIFGPGGMLSQIVPNYEVRLPQLYMARLVQRSIEMEQPAVVEAGTGVGKSFAYAAICMAMGKRVIISTSNKNLQMQLYRKDVPLLLQLFPRQSVALAVGKSNYACRYKADDPISRMPRIEDPALRNWYSSTATGNTEEITFAVNWEQLSKITVDDECAGKHCPFYYDCFYYGAKEDRKLANVIITNHALLCLHNLYPEAGILPTADVIVVDEAHKLPDYARNTLGFQTTIGHIQRAIRKTQRYVSPQDAVYTNAEDAAALLANELLPLIPDSKDLQIEIHKDQELRYGKLAAQTLTTLADEVWEEDAAPNNGDEKKRARRANALRTLASNLAIIHSYLPGLVRWMEPDRQARNSAEVVKLCAAPYDVSAFIGQLAGFTPTPKRQAPDHTHCSRCGRKLTASVVHVLEGKPYGPDCIRMMDAFGDAEEVALSEWLSKTEAEPAPDAPIQNGETPVIFCSATLAAPDLVHFLRTCGLPDALQMQAQSPFDYGKQALLYVPNGSSPMPNSPEYAGWVLSQMDQLVQAAQGGTFFLFTSYVMMNQAARYFEPILMRKGLTMLVQGELPKLETAKRFRENGNAVLFATKSFFEGVSIDGDALRLVVVDKLPFEAPSPLSRAMDAQAMEYARTTLGLVGQRLERYPFEALAVPKMIIDLKQALGRLIRTHSDTGVMAVLDTRLRATQYGRNQVLPSLPAAPLVADLAQVQAFFAAAKTQDSAPVDDAPALTAPVTKPEEPDWP